MVANCTEGSGDPEGVAVTAGCKARQQSDQMRCDACDLTWDTNDDDPPVCGLDGMPAIGMSYPSAAKLDVARNWREDFGHENGRYVNMCGQCELPFIGHKRRRTCKVCAVSLETARTGALNKIKNLLD